MSRHRLLGGLTASAIAVSGLAAMSVAPAHAVTTITTISPGELNTTETRATGHNDFRFDGVHIWTEGATSTDKAAGYFALEQPLAAVGEPTWEWSSSMPAEPGKQLVMDWHSDDTWGGILVGETVYGDRWWLTNSAPASVKQAAPSCDGSPEAVTDPAAHCTGGNGSYWHGTLDEWRAAFPDATVPAAGWSMGSGLHGDGVLRSMTIGDTTHRFSMCGADFDDTAKTYTLTENCDTFTTMTVPDGWTLNGDRHVITAHEDAARPNFPGPIVTSATGDSAAPAEMHVKDLFITTDFTGQNSGGALAGVKFDRAGGSVTDVTIDGVTHGNGVQEGHGLWVRNRDSVGGTAVPRASIVVDGLDVTRYQKSGVIFDGNLTFAMTNSFVGHSADRSGAPIFGIAANSVQISRTAHGSLTDSEIELNEYDDQAGDGSAATGVLLYNAKRVELARNLITGFDADVAVYAFNTTFDVDTELTLSCNLVSREKSAGDYDPYGIGLFSEAQTAVQTNISVRALDNTFLGWQQDVEGTADLRGQGECLPNAAEDVAVSGGRNATAVAWAPGDDFDFAPRTGYEVTVTGPSFSRSKLVDADETSTTFRGIPAKRDYTVTVSTANVSGSTAAEATLHHTGLTIDQADRRIVVGQQTTIEGVLSSSAAATRGPTWPAESWCSRRVRSQAARGRTSTGPTPRRTAVTRSPSGQRRRTPATGCGTTASPTWA
jgi:hypothetical protein